ncbi:MAG: vWA domain-containing protein [Phototrophicaceae bacterium]
MTTFEKIRKAALARLDAGEPVHIILQDYADYEDRLRPILEDATGASFKPLASYEPKRKAKNKTSLSPILVILAALIIIVMGLGIAVFTIVPFSSAIIDASNPLIVTTSSDCVGIPQPEITSLYAIQSQTSRNQDRSGESDIAYETSEEVAYEGSGTTGSGGGMSASESVRSATSDVPMPSSAPMDAAYADDADSSETMGFVVSAPDMVGDAILNIDEIEIEPAPIIEERLANAQQSEPLRAGEIDDNAEWDTYQQYRQDYLANYGTNFVRDVDTTGRQIIRVLDNNGKPVLNACVQIFNGDTPITSALTYATGMTLFFPNLNDDTRYVDTFRVVVTKADARVESTIDRDIIGGVTTIELPISQSNEQLQLDVMFLLDATGSMGDEIAQLQDNILSISEQIDALSSDIDVRYGLVTYRDRGDQYVTRVHDFTYSVAEFQEQLLSVQASGGGDYPESLNEGVDMALNAVEWRMDDTIRLMFLVADAPPHVDYQDDADYSLLMQDALARGIKVHPIASGGLEPEGEFVLRQIAQVTMGRFLFLTYDDGVVGTVGDDRPDLEVGSPEDEQDIGDYSVSQLDELVLRLITDEIAARD